MSEVAVIPGPNYWRQRVPEEHRQSLDTRLLWLWNQRFGTVQTVRNESPDTLDVTAATMLLQAVLFSDLDAINLLFQRLEGSPVSDEEVMEQVQKIRV